MPKQIPEKTLKKAVRLYKKHGSIRLTGERMGVACSTVHKYLVRARHLGLYKPLPKKPKKAITPDILEREKELPTRKKGLSKSQFQETHDPDTRTILLIRKGIKGLKEDEILTDTQFRDRCGHPSTIRWRVMANLEEFKLYQFRCDSRIWWALPSTIHWALDTISKARQL